MGFSQWHEITSSMWRNAKVLGWKNWTKLNWKLRFTCWFFCWWRWYWMARPGGIVAGFFPLQCSMVLAAWGSLATAKDMLCPLKRFGHVSGRRDVFFSNHHLLAVLVFRWPTLKQLVHLKIGICQNVEVGVHFFFSQRLINPFSVFYFGTCIFSS